ncbi:RagB/SusD family nutrient uptake outer membrane protein [Mucilaginibacter celer]|uniref:RagB/SusD family nutrient uptake outer membrane protein n=1 Tax=Mucilaginibacter celer TaxID=2305508 RepID=A0A494VSU7_9SPHI|nr:RagB/SusD family nutrient uptake outer membrane protein [Mucilaginibacter celer]AYL96480.1 RagB/SusD family nutrient uptake outer membrane protein [Mucilaginibacter celer]
MKFLNIKSIHICAAVLMLVLAGGCKKAIEIGPSLVTANAGNAFSSNSAAQSVVAGIYSRMSQGSFFQGQYGISINMGLAADELTNINSGASSFGPFYTNNYSPALAPSFWAEFYKLLYFCNTAIDGISNSPSVTGNVKNQLLGEVKFLRGFIFFYALNLYGTPPLTLSTDYTINNTIGNSTPDALYKQIINDLKAAQAALADNIYVDANGATVTDRVRPNKQTASAMLARVYLYMRDWKNAEDEATSVLGSATYTLLPQQNISQVFLKGSRETIWALQPTSLVYLNTIDAYYLIVNTNYRASLQFPISPQLQNAFEPNDARFTNWVSTFTTPATPAVTYYYANKYKVSSVSSTIAVTEYPIVMRLAEQFLIRAEARAQQNNLTGAATDLNTIRTRAGLGATTASGQADMITAIMHERQVELFTEWGHRWFDLKRNNLLNDVMTTVAPTKGTTWASFKQLMPIPPADIQADPNIVQNPGYN